MRHVGEREEVALVVGGDEERHEEFAAAIGAHGRFVSALLEAVRQVGELARGVVAVDNVAVARGHEHRADLEIPDQRRDLGLRGHVIADEVHHDELSDPLVDGQRGDHAVEEGGVRLAGSRGAAGVERECREERGRQHGCGANRPERTGVGGGPHPSLLHPRRPRHDYAA